MTLRERVARALDPDRALQAVMASLTEAAGVRYALEMNQGRWRPGRPLKLLLAGYSGTRNTGSDLRVEEMIRQFRAILGDDNLQLSIITINPELSVGYFRTVRQLHMPTFFPPFLSRECPKHDGVVACEGSMFKSKFASALSTMMAGALGLANVEGKLSVGYGAEAGEMSPSLQDFVRKQCKSSLIICRNEPSRRVLDALGIRTKGGTDTAWTFQATDEARGAQLLRECGWDGQKKLLAVCPINPFWWPVRPDLLKGFAHRFGGQFREEHYKSFYFHEWSEVSAEKYDAYLDGLAFAVERFVRESDAFPILVGMERLDRGACSDLADRLPFRPPLFVSDEYDMYELVSVLCNASLMISSRFHAMVTSMPARVPSAGVTMDERIRNLMHDRGHSDLLLEVDEEGLGEKALDVLRHLERESERIAREIAGFIPSQLKLMGQMGMDFEDELLSVYPEFPRRDRPRSWEQYLPKLSPALERLLELGEEA